MWIRSGRALPAHTLATVADKSHSSLLARPKSVLSPPGLFRIAGGDVSVANWRVVLRFARSVLELIDYGTERNEKLGLT
jgi:hypothetical protein